MKSDVCKLTQDAESLNVVLTETEKASEYVGLDQKQASRMRLLAEELVGMLPELLSFSKGEFWVETNGKAFELHASLIPEEPLTAYKREQLLEISTTGKNEAAKGIMNKIRLAAQFMLLDYNHIADYMSQPMDFYQFGMTTSSMWSLNTYSSKVKSVKGEPWDELERSIIANVADDVLVGLQGNRVDIIVKKAF